jgi:hypothetical protein
MRGLSSAPHRHIMSVSHAASVKLVDRALPAVQHLVGDGSIDVLRPPVEAAGGVIESVRPVHVQYRPGSDVVVRYSAEISWGGRPAKRDTLVAASAINGPLPGTITVTADTSDGPLDIGVWRWPFDPVLTGLGTAVTPVGVADLLDVDHHDIRLEVVAYRPTERAVVRVTSGAGDVLSYLKVVAPGETASIAARHDTLVAAGVPAPRVRASDDLMGVLVLEPLVGPTLRELIKFGDGGWVDPEEFDRLADRFGQARLDGAPLPSRLADGTLHARMLGTVVPKLRGRLDELIARFDDAVAPAADSTIHGDLHEAQIIVRDATIVGVLDIDDAGPGAAIDDRANLIARLLFRSALDTTGRPELAEYADRIRSASVSRFDPARLDLHTSAALVGLATGPFRVQGPNWRAEVTTLIERASMRELSASTHRGLTQRRA